MAERIKKRIEVLAMREILFRGKRIDNGRWVVGWLIGCPKESPDNGKLKRAWIILKIADFACHCFADAKARFHEVDPETVGQFTGLLDKNRNKIFEGDVCKVTNWRYANYEVIWYNGSWRVYSDNIYEKIGNNLTTGCFEIIGNIHE